MRTHRESRPESASWFESIFAKCVTQLRHSSEGESRRRATIRTGHWMPQLAPPGECLGSESCALVLRTAGFRALFPFSVWSRGRGGDNGTPWDVLTQVCFRVRSPGASSHGHEQMSEWFKQHAWEANRVSATKRCMNL